MVVGFLSPPPIVLAVFEPIGAFVVAPDLGDGLAGPPLALILPFSAGFDTDDFGAPKRDGVTPTFFTSVLADAAVDAVDGLLSPPIVDLAVGALGFYNVSTIPYHFLISSLTFSICTFI